MLGIGRFGLRFLETPEKVQEGLSEGFFIELSEGLQHHREALLDGERQIAHLRLV